MESISVQEQPSLTLKLMKLRNQEGLVRFAVFSSAQAEAFPTDTSKAVKTGALPILGIPLIIPITGLRFGRYAVTL
ncbi:MAG TPA: DUF2141 domain-containing protein, partial [Candidatus Caenarcaniphilales bacterium]